MTITALIIFLLVIFVLIVALVGKQKAGTTEQLEHAQEDAYELIHDAMEDAREIETAAELASIEQTARDRLQSKELLTTYEHKLTALLNTFTRTLEERSAQSEEQLGYAVADLNQHAQETIEESGAAVKERLDSYFAQIDELVAGFGEALHKRTDEEITKEMASLTAHLDAYKQAKEQMIDQHVVSIVEKVITHTTGKALTIEQHHELIIDALEKAKAESFFS